jgi:hypothetical protein
MDNNNNNDFLQKIKDSMKSEDHNDHNEILIIKDNEDDNHQLKDHLYFFLETMIEKKIKEILNDLLDSGKLDYKIKTIIDKSKENENYNKTMIKSVVKECLKELLTES